MAASNLIFIRSLMPRSGINFLARLLMLHPDCDFASVNEDRLRRLESLHSFAERIVESMNDEWPCKQDRTVEKLCECIGFGLRSFLAFPTDDNDLLLDKPVEDSLHSEKKIISKEPSIQGLRFFRKFFPKATLVIILRDGRSVVDSCERAFGDSLYILRDEIFEDNRSDLGACEKEKTIGNSFEQWAIKWNRRASEYLSIRGEIENHPLTQVIHYEDLCANTPSEMKRLLEAIGLDVQRYQFENSERLPVFGSSYQGQESGEWSWKVTEKSDDFKPISRWEGWSEQQKLIFDKVAGSNLRTLGYLN